MATYRGKARVYDLLNCGPRNRFTVSGKLVHNCQFLGGKGSLHSMARIYRTSFTDEEATEVIDRWRSENKWATRFGERIWEAILWCMENPGEPRVVGRLTFVYDAAYRSGTLFMVLPNGDPLLYTGIKWREVKQKDKDTGEEKVETRLTVWKGRGVAPIWKGEILNNATQGCAAALLRSLLRRVEQDGLYEIALHTHDECVLCVDEDKAEAARDYLVGLMQERPEWAPRLPLKADPAISEFYTKTED